MDETLTEKEVVYIAGKVTGLDYNEVFAKFKTAQIDLEVQGFTVLNPCEHIQPDEDWHKAMRIAIGLLIKADFIYLLPDWYRSNGAIMERELALGLGIGVIDLN